MAMSTVRRISARMLKAGRSKIKFKPESHKKISEALTREDVRALIKDGAIYALAKRGVCRVRGRKKQEQKRKGRRKGKGSRKGTPNSRLRTKDAWVAKVRAQRKYLRQLLEKKRLDRKHFRKAYMMVKGNAFKGIRMLEAHLKESKMLKK